MSLPKISGDTQASLNRRFRAFRKCLNRNYSAVKGRTFREPRKAPRS